MDSTPPSPGGDAPVTLMQKLHAAGLLEHAALGADFYDLTLTDEGVSMMDRLRGLDAAAGGLSREECHQLFVLARLGAPELGYSGPPPEPTEG